MNMMQTKKVLATVLAVALVMVLAIGLGAPVVRAEAGPHVEKINIDSYQEGIAPKPQDAGYAGWLFAGWFTDAGCTKAADRATATGEKYAKFVPAGVLSAKFQVQGNTTAESGASKIRFVSTVDSLQYKEVGFKYKIGDREERTYTTKTVLSKIVAANDGVAFTYEPTVFHELSKYFITLTLIDIPNSAFDMGIRVTPYWVTLDGTEVLGVGRYIRVEDSYRNIVNVPVRLYDDASVAAGLLTVSFDPNKYDFVDCDNGTVFDITNWNVKDGKVYCVGYVGDITNNTKADGMFVNLRFQLKDGQTAGGTFTVENPSFCNNAEQDVTVAVVEAAYKAAK